jgi:hypothetical protein
MGATDRSIRFDPGVVFPAVKPFGHSGNRFDAIQRPGDKAFRS